MVEISSPIRKDMSNMSFVGICNMNGGIIAFADSKSTLTFSDGKKQEDKDRGITPKIFKNTKFIFVTHGNNTMFSTAKEIYLEDWIKDNLNCDEEIENFFEKMYKTMMSDKPTHHDGKYYFYIGSKDSYGYFTQSVFINCSNNEFTISNKSYDKVRIYGGSDNYVEIFKKYCAFYYDKPIKKYAEDIKTQIEALIKLFDTQVHYNPVGLPIQIGVFQ